ncbi:extracellular solute-binding protein [Paenibacillus sp. ACRRX]|uniref:extracellular solute-binding protein n=1 Tax=unclassified Paenibacillus TaxID=185978 RepID=UPI001EF4F76F|nr:MULTISPECIES: extracellular solute-binding protein [unclassified Paenibacillus]MCG7408488.1 extracellular solute-binding protein [Paenibacillus sp. ACRRX]MDK8182726.1 extracellular solute-binding protein [Paenibacillus sp. UMB4589-SE434]
MPKGSNAVMGHKKIWAMLLSMTLLISLLSGCGGSSDKAAENGSTGSEASANLNMDGFPIVKEPITLTMMGQDVGMQNWQDMEFFKQMQEKTGIKFDFRNAPLDSFDTKRNLVFASGDYPDVFFSGQLKAADEVNYGGQGVLIPLEGLIDKYAPNLKKILDEHPDIRKSITTPDGHIYALPNIDLDAGWYRGPIWYNGKFLKALGMDKVPSTTEELYTYLKRVKDEDPNGNGKKDEIPFVSVKLDDVRMWLLGSWGIFNEQIYADREDKVHYTPMEPGYKEYLTFLNRLWNDGLLDKETFSQTDEQKKAKGKNNQVALFSDYHAYFTLGGEPSQDDPMYAPVKSEVVGSPVAAKHPGLVRGVFAITNKNKHPEATMRWVDYLYSTEGADLISSGPEGVLWKYTNKADFTKEKLEVPGGKDREEYRATLTPDYGVVLPKVSNEDTKRGFEDDFARWLKKETSEKIDPISKVPFPSVYLSQDEQSEASAKLSDLDTYVKQMEAKFVTGQEPLANWDKYLETCKKMGGERVAEIYQAAYDRWKQG